MIERLEKIVHHDREHSHPLDTTDEGLLADLEDHGSKGVECLALVNGRKKKHKD